MPESKELGSGNGFLKNEGSIRIIHTYGRKGNSGHLC